MYLQPKVHLGTACCYLDPHHIGLPPPKHHEVCCTMCAFNNISSLYAYTTEPQLPDGKKEKDLAADANVKVSGTLPIEVNDI